MFSKFFNGCSMAVHSNRGVELMKKYEELLSVLSLLEAKQRELEVHIENAYTDMMDNWANASDRNRYKGYWDKLMDQAREINKRIEVSNKALTLTIDDQKVCWIGEDGLYMQYKYLDKSEMNQLMTFLQLMNEEVQS